MNLFIGLYKTKGSISRGQNSKKDLRQNTIQQQKYQLTEKTENIH